MTLDTAPQTQDAEVASGGYSTNTVQHTDDQIIIVDPNDIEIIEARNPRRTRSKTDMDEMRESIRTKGVMQSVLIRPNPNTEESGKPYELAAGYSRTLLALEVGVSGIPALLRNMTDAEALESASIENIARNDMTPMDEGHAARNMMAQGADAEEVCRILGWTKTFLDGRIQLTHCTDEVSQAFCEKQIKLGHAQLLSGLRDEAQNNALKAIIKNSYTVDQFREKLDQLSLRLKAASFDLTECATCPHNSSTQTSLFGDAESVGKARCLNKTCFDKKTEAHLESVKADLAESFHKVAFSHEIPTGTTTVVVERGANGVGTEQAEACKGCQHFGATIDSALGSKAAVTKNACFNLKCHGEKVADNKNLIATDANQEGEAAKPEAKASGGAEQPANTDKTASTGKAPAKKKEAKPASSAIPKKIVEQHHKIHRTAASSVAADDEKLTLIGGILCLIRDAKVELPKKPEGWPMSISDGANAAKAASLLDTLPVEKLHKLQNGLVRQMLAKSTAGFGGENEKDVFGGLAQWVATSRNADLTKHFTMDSEYLSAFTKPMVEQRLKASGFDKHYETDTGEGEFKKLANGKKGDLIKAVKESKFDFAGFLPEGLSLSK
ncbi:PRTRC system ParB family protein [Marinobacter salarius]|uniref:Chromosome-partitioning protein Spo0J n=1 Tax=Marinobacter salarius TaxID=1420917 RepID=A0A1W6KFH1_9GAMM|nr:PRTRC system ParB family protein [Marinobacter salarius]ARM86157.1 chromosome-partitioning protein Spo0J [Marinobacter salarius]